MGHGRLCIQGNDQTSKCGSFCFKISLWLEIISHFPKNEFSVLSSFLLSIRLSINIISFLNRFLGAIQELSVGAGGAWYFLVFWNTTSISLENKTKPFCYCDNNSIHVLTYTGMLKTKIKIIVIYIYI